MLLSVASEAVLVNLLLSQILGHFSSISLLGCGPVSIDSFITTASNGVRFLHVVECVSTLILSFSTFDLGIIDNFLVILLNVVATQVNGFAQIIEEVASKVTWGTESFSIHSTENIVLSVNHLEVRGS